MSWISTVACVLVPLLLILVIRRAVLQHRQRMMLRTQHPDEQWLWRADWASRTAADTSSSYSPLIWLLTAVWTLISFPVFFLVDRRRDEPVLMVFAVFPIIAVILIGVAIYQTLRRRKYGISLCRFDALPLPLGRTMHGEVQTRVGEVPQDGFLLRLTCLRRIVRSSGKSTSVHEKLLWQDEQRAGAGAAMPSPNGVRVPFRFALPLEAEESDERNSRDRVIWRLEVTSDVPGIDYRAVFELPVFTRSESQQSETFATAFETPWTPPPSIAIEGDRIVVKPAATLFDAFFYILFVAIWFTALAFVYKFGGPILAVGFFALFGGVVLYFALDQIAGRSTLTINQSRIVSRRTFLGTRVVPSADVVEIEPQIGNPSSKRALYNLEARTRDGRSVTIAKCIRSRRDAEAVAKRIMRMIGR